MDPTEVRMKNFIPENEFPATIATGLSVRQRELCWGYEESAQHGEL